MASEKCLAKGSPAPCRVPKGLIRVYSMRFCPYAERARLVLKAKGIKHEVININLAEKPEWFLKKNPLGMVPVLETDNEDIIYESPITCEYLDEQYGGENLYPTCPLGKALQKMMLEHYSKVVQLFYKIAMGRKKGDNVSEMEVDLEKKLEAFEKDLVEKKTEFFAGDRVGMIDYMMWPWFEREKSFGLTQFLVKTPGLRKWIKSMKEVPAVKDTMHSDELLQGFVDSWLGGKADYDYGL